MRWRAIGVVTAALLAFVGSPLISTAQASVSAPPCRDVLILGARGSGQLGPGSAQRWVPRPADPLGLGPQVLTATTRLVASAGSVRTFDQESVYYAADPVPFPAPFGPSWPTFSTRLSRYFDHMNIGIKNAEKDLRAAAATCPDQHFVLIGYSQGAIIMHRVLLHLSPAIARRVDGAVLIADGDQVPKSDVHRFGTAPVTARGVAQTQRDVSGATTTPFVRSMAQKVMSVCDARDIVCDFRGYNLEGINTHETHYIDTRSTWNAAETVASNELYTPLPAIPPVGATVGSPLTEQLQAKIAGGTRLEWRIAPGATLPGGLRLSPTGLLSGTPVRAATTRVGVQVRAVVLGQAGRWVDATVPIVVSTTPAPTPQPSPPPLFTGAVSLTDPLVYDIAATGDGTVWGIPDATLQAGSGSLEKIDLSTGSSQKEDPGVGLQGAHLVSTPDGSLWYSGSELARRGPDGVWRVVAHAPFDHLSPAADSSVWAVSGSDLFRFSASGVMTSYAQRYSNCGDGVAVAPDGTAWTIQRTDDLCTLGTASTPPTYAFVGYRPDGSVAEVPFAYSNDTLGGGLRPEGLFARPDGSLWWVARDKMGDFGDRVGTMSSAGTLSAPMNLPGYLDRNAAVVDLSGRLWAMSTQTYDQAGRPSNTSFLIGPGSIKALTTAPFDRFLGVGARLADGRLVFNGGISLFVVDPAAY